MKKFLFSFCIITLSTPLFAQRPGSTPGKGMYPEKVQFDHNNAPAFVRGAVYLPAANGRLISTPGKLLHEEHDKLGQQHYRTQQVVNGYPVENAIFIQHVGADGKVISGNGRWISEIPLKLATRASLPGNAALQKALQEVGAAQYKWQVPAEEAQLKQETNDPKATYFPKAELVYFTGDNNVDTAQMRLAYRFDIYAHRPLSRQDVFVDAVNGNVLGTKNRIHQTNMPATAYTVYSGSRPIMTDYSNGMYRLRETGRGNGIQTFNLQQSNNYSSAIDFTNVNTTWNNVNAAKDEYATDAHWGAEKTYDYYKDRFNRNSIDDAGFALNSYVHYSTNYFNAYWDGLRMTYGDGDASGSNQPLTTLDICAHEITHGLTEFTSHLNYTGESGALNEGFSDIFGTAIENYARPEKWDWQIASDLFTLRSMSDPNAYQQPDTYNGKYWYTYNDVHINSGVLNHWFYLLAQGETGTNDIGCNYAVSGIGINKAAAIAYRTNTVYLFPTARYIDAAKWSVKAAEDLYGSGSYEAAQTVNAWTAVGVSINPEAPSLLASQPVICTGGATTLSVTAGSLNSATGWNWYAGNCGGPRLGTGSSVTVSPTATTTYYVRGEGGCIPFGDCGAVTVTVAPPPVPVIIASGPTSFCSNGSVVLTASAGTSYLWSTGALSPSIMATQSGNYSVTVTNNAGCSATSSSITVTAADNQAPVPYKASLPEVTGECSATVTTIPTATDNCKGTITATTKDPLTYHTQGNHVITWLYEDGNGNSFTQQQHVIVTGALPPVITLPAVPVWCYNATGNYTLPPATAKSNCGINTSSLAYNITGATVRSGSGGDASGYFNLGTSTITWTVKDINGITGTNALTVVVNSTFTVTVADVYTVSAGGQPNTLYPGYGPGSITIAAVPAGGTPGYSYLWSNGGTTSSIIISTSVPGTYTFTVTVKDSRGCTATLTKLIAVVDVLCGNKNDKISVCKVPPGNPTNEKTNCISESAVANQLSKGSYLGACGSDASSTVKAVSTAAQQHVATEQQAALGATASPNPSTAGFRLQTTGNSRMPVVIRITDVTGRLIETRYTVVTGGIQLGNNFKPGIYFTEIRRGKEKLTLKLVKQ